MKKTLAWILALALLFALGAAAEGRVTGQGVGQGIDGDVVGKVEADAATIYSEAGYLLSIRNTRRRGDANVGGRHPPPCRGEPEVRPRP